MRRAFALLVTASAGLATATAAPVTSDALLIQAGPSAGDGAVGLAWISECSDSDRLVGIRVLQAKGVSGVIAICAALNQAPAGTAWAAAPAAVEGPPPPAPPVMITRDVTHTLRGRIVRVNDDGNWEVRAAVRAELVRRETIPDPDTPPGKPVIEFSQTSAAEIVCPEGSFVKGIRYETPKAGGIAAVELSCAQLGKRAEIVAMTEVRKRSKNADPPVRDIASLQRVDCRGMTSNPTDGEAAKAIFGSLDESGRVQSIGLSCAPALDAPRTVQQLVDDLALPRLFGR